MYNFNGKYTYKLSQNACHIYKLPIELIHFKYVCKRPTRKASLSKEVINF